MCSSRYSRSGMWGEVHSGGGTRAAVERVAAADTGSVGHALPVPSVLPQLERWGEGNPPEVLQKYSCYWCLVNNSCFKYLV